MTATAASLGEVSDLIGALAWPLVVLTLALIFRRPLVGLLNRDRVKATLPGGASFVASDPDSATDQVVNASASKNLAVDEAAAQREIAAVTGDLARLRRSPRLLWVDDRPSDDQHEVLALEALGLTVELATSTADALAKAARRGPFDGIVSDMGRPSDPRAGYTLLNALRQAGDDTPFVIYADPDQPEDIDEAVHHGAVGSTNDPTELMRLVRRALRSSSAREAAAEDRPSSPPDGESD